MMFWFDIFMYVVGNDGLSFSCLCAGVCVGLDPSSRSYLRLFRREL